MYQNIFVYVRKKYIINSYHNNVFNINTNKWIEKAKIKNKNNNKNIDYGGKYRDKNAIYFIIFYFIPPKIFFFDNAKHCQLITVRIWNKMNLTGH